MLGQADARKIDVNATIRLIGPEQLHRQFRVLLVQTTVVVSVDDADITLPGVDRFQHSDVIGEHVGRQVIDPTLEDIFGLLGTVGFDQGRRQRLVVDLLRRTQAQAPFPIFVRQRFVGGQVSRFYPVGGVGDGPRAQAQTGPAVGGRAVLFRNVGVDHG